MDRIVTYSNFIYNHHSLKTEEWRVRLTVGGDQLEHPHEGASLAASLIETKFIINNTISDGHKGGNIYCSGS